LICHHCSHGYSGLMSSACSLYGNRVSSLGIVPHRCIKPPFAKHLLTFTSTHTSTTQHAGHNMPDTTTISTLSATACTVTSNFFFNHHRQVTNCNEGTNNLRGLNFIPDEIQEHTAGLAQDELYLVYCLIAVGLCICCCILGFIRKWVCCVWK